MNAKFEDIKIALKYAEENSPYYKRAFQKMGIDIEKDVKDYNDISKIPITRKNDFSKYNDDFLCVEHERIIDYVSTSGTMGHPVSFYLSDNDLERLALNEKLSFECAGVTSEDTMMLMTTINKRFMAGLAYFLGARKLGAGIVRTGPGVPGLQWESIFRFKPTVLIVVPEFLLALVAYAEANDIDYHSSPIKSAICIGQSIRNENLELNALGRRIKEKWDVDLYSTYAATEMATAFTECNQFSGGHLSKELLYVEVLDSSGEAVKDGELGEVVFTSLGVEAMPLIRYATGDMCRVYYETCKCGRDSLRLGPVQGRKNNMLKIKGTSIYPAQVNNVLDNFNEIKHYLVEAYSDELGRDQIRVVVPDIIEDSDVQAKLIKTLQDQLRVIPELCFQKVEAIIKQRIIPENRKPIKFVDNRR